MAAAARVEVRPRTTGEILDDAWGLYFADAPLLLALSGLFLAPAFVAVIWLLTSPAPANGWQQLLWPALAALLLPLTGLGSGACQEFFHRSAEGGRPSLGSCLAACLRHAGNHAAARGVVGALFFLGGCLLFLPGLAVLASAAAVHPILVSGERSIFSALRLSGQEAQRQPAKNAAVVLSRLPLFVVVVVNLYLLVRVILWIGDHLAGFDLAVPAVILSADNPVFMTALLMSAWLLLMPYFEAANYLLHVDGRARYEGLDLWYRVRQFFPLLEKSHAGALLVVVGAALVAPLPAAAADARLSAVQDARREIQSVSNEIMRAEPYPGSSRWVGRLRTTTARLEREAPANKNSYRWLHQALEGFNHRGRESALQVLTDVDRRLGLIEDSLRPAAAALPEGKGAMTNVELRKLLPHEEDDAANTKKEPVREAKRQAREKRDRRAEKEANDVEIRGRPEARGPGVVAAHPTGGFGVLGWLIVAGIMAALLIIAVKSFLDGRKEPRSKPVVQESGQTTPSLEAILTRPDEYSVTGMWREADDLARAGRAREAVRTLYLAVLALLHRANLIHFERTRTNGEYVRQLRSRENLRAPFAGMTHLFEAKWYSESTAETADYTRCRELADGIRETAKDAQKV